MGIFSLSRNEPLTTPVNERSTFFPAFLERLRKPADPWLAALDDRLAARKTMRQSRSDAARRGWTTRRGHRA